MLELRLTSLQSFAPLNSTTLKVYLHYQWYQQPCWCCWNSSGFLYVMIISHVATANSWGRGKHLSLLLYSYMTGIIGLPAGKANCCRHNYSAIKLIGTWIHTYFLTLHLCDLHQVLQTPAITMVNERTLDKSFQDTNYKC